MSRTTLQILAGAAFAVVLATSTAWGQGQTQRVAGTIEGVDGATLIVKTRDSGEVRVSITDNVVVFGVADDCTTIPYNEALQQVPLAFTLPDRVHTTLAEAASASATLPDIEAQLQALQLTYDTTQQQITETYNQQRPTWNTYQEAEQALHAEYQRALATWEALNAEWQALQREAEQARATRK